MRIHKAAALVMNVCILAMGALIATPAMALHRWSDNRVHLDINSSIGRFTFKDQVYLAGEIPQIIDVRTLFKEGWLLPEFTFCEITTHQANQNEGQIVLIESTYYFKTKTPAGCYLISAPYHGGFLVRFEHTVFTPQAGSLKMRRHVVDSWEKPIQLSVADLQNPNLFSENPAAKALIENARPPYETYEESTLDLREHF